MSRFGLSSQELIRFLFSLTVEQSGHRRVTSAKSYRDRRRADIPISALAWVIHTRGFPPACRLLRKAPVSPNNDHLESRRKATSIPFSSTETQTERKPRVMKPSRSPQIRSPTWLIHRHGPPWTPSKTWQREKKPGNKKDFSVTIIGNWNQILKNPKQATLTQKRIGWYPLHTSPIHPLGNIKITTTELQCSPLTSFFRTNVFFLSVSITTDHWREHTHYDARKGWTK